MRLLNNYKREKHGIEYFGDWFEYTTLNYITPSEKFGRIGDFLVRNCGKKMGSKVVEDNFSELTGIVCLSTSLFVFVPFNITSSGIALLYYPFEKPN